MGCQKSNLVIVISCVYLSVVVIWLHSWSRQRRDLASLFSMTSPLDENLCDYKEIQSSYQGRAPKDPGQVQYQLLWV